MEAVTVVDEYLQNIFNESVNRTLNNIFSSIESINELPFVTKDYDFDKLYLYIMDIMASDENLDQDDINTDIKNYIKTSIIDFLERIGIMLSNERGMDIALIHLEDILNALNTLTHLDSELAAEQLKEYTDLTMQEEKDRTMFYITVILADYRKFTISELLEIITDVTDEFIYNSMVRVVELKTINDTSDDELLNKIYSLIDFDNTFGRTMFVNKCLNEGFIPTNISESLDIAYGMSNMHNKHHELIPYEMVASVYLTEDNSIGDTLTFIKDNIDMSNLSILENNDTQISSINNEIVNLITNINMRSK